MIGRETERSNTVAVAFHGLQTVGVVFMLACIFYTLAKPVFETSFQHELWAHKTTEVVVAFRGPKL